MTDAAELAALRKAILDLHGARAEHAESVLAKDTFSGETVWDGVVEVFALPEHAAGKAYAWRHESDGGWLAVRRCAAQAARGHPAQGRASGARGRIPRATEESAMSTKMGRPKLPKSERKSGRIEIRVSGPEQAAMDAAAEKAGLKLSEWLRDVALKAARRAD